MSNIRDFYGTDPLVVLPSSKFHGASLECRRLHPDFVYRTLAFTAYNVTSPVVGKILGAFNPFLRSLGRSDDDLYNSIAYGHYVYDFEELLKLEDNLRDGEELSPGYSLYLALRFRLLPETDTFVEELLKEYINILGSATLFLRSYRTPALSQQDFLRVQLQFLEQVLVPRASRLRELFCPYEHARLYVNTDLQRFGQGPMESHLQIEAVESWNVCPFEYTSPSCLVQDLRTRDVTCKLKVDYRTGSREEHGQLLELLKQKLPFVNMEGAYYLEPLWPVYCCSGCNPGDIDDWYIMLRLDLTRIYWRADFDFDNGYRTVFDKLVKPLDDIAGSAEKQGLFEKHRPVSFEVAGKIFDQVGDFIRKYML